MLKGFFSIINLSIVTHLSNLNALYTKHLPGMYPILLTGPGMYPIVLTGQLIFIWMVAMRVL